MQTAPCIPQLFEEMAARGAAPGCSQFLAFCRDYAISPRMVSKERVVALFQVRQHSCCEPPLPPPLLLPPLSLLLLLLLACCCCLLAAAAAAAAAAALWHTARAVRSSAVSRF